MNLTKNTNYPNIVKLLKLMNQFKCPIVVSDPVGYRVALFLNAELHEDLMISHDNLGRGRSIDQKALIFELNVKESEIKELIYGAASLIRKYSGEERDFLNSYPSIYKDAQGFFHISPKDIDELEEVNKVEDKWQNVGRL